MQTYYIKWSPNSHRPEDEQTVKIATEPELNQVYQKPEDGSYLYNGDEPKMDQIYYSNIELPAGCKHCYAVTYRSSSDSGMTSHASLCILESFDEVLAKLDNDYLEEHQYDVEECELCQELDGEERCLQRALGTFATERFLEYNTSTMHYKAVFISKKRKATSTEF
jgi:hypothetical protein